MEVTECFVSGSEMQNLWFDFYPSGGAGVFVYSVGYQSLLSGKSKKGSVNITVNSLCTTSQMEPSNYHGESIHAKYLSTGIPQGSVFDPVLFAVYTALLGFIFHQHSFSYPGYVDDRVPPVLPPG